MPATYENLATTTLTSNQTTVTFSSISGSFTDLLVVLEKATNIASQDNFRINNDAGTNYSWTVLQGNGTAASSTRYSNQAQIYFENPGLQTDSTKRTIAFFHFMNYSNTTTNKTVLMRVNNADFGTIGSVGLWRSTSAITRLDFRSDQQFTTGSTFTLYGIKAA